MSDQSRVTRRQVVQVAALAAATVSLSPFAAAQGEAPVSKRRIPRTKDELPVIGLGTNAYRAETPEEFAPLREVLKRMPELGGSVIDTAPGYGRSEQVLGQLLAELGNRNRFFLATKVTAPGDDVAAAKAMFEESLRRLRVQSVDLLQVHNLTGVDALMPQLLEWKRAGTVRYIGITTSQSEDHPQLMAFMRRHPLDFIQVDYSIDNRAAAAEVLPLARERQMGVLINTPLGGRRSGNLLAKLKDRPLPDLARELDATSWAQFLLKYVVSHPAVTVAIPGTTKIRHLEDNQRAARGRMPDDKLRKRMEEYWASVSS